MSLSRIPLSRPYVTGNELRYLEQLFSSGSLAAGGDYTRQVEARLAELTDCEHTLLLNSCSAALELAGALLDLQPGDEVIVPSFTFVTTASSFARYGARLVFAEIRADTCNIDEALVEALITPKTRAIIAVDYAGVMADVESLAAIAHRHGVALIEDAAQALGSSQQACPAGSLADLATFSFHDTKNFVSGEGGALCVNDEKLVDRAHIIRDKGTNRREFLLGQADKYTWVDLGASFVQSEVLAAVLQAQLEATETITERRKTRYYKYLQALSDLQTDGALTLPIVPEGFESNFHIFHVLLRDPAQRPALLERFAKNGIGASFHYVPLHSSPQGRRFSDSHRELPITDLVSSSIVRLPLYPDLDDSQQERVIDTLRAHFA